MKIVLTAINAKYIHSNPAIYSLKACADGIGAGTGIKSGTDIDSSEGDITGTDMDSSAGDITGTDMDSSAGDITGTDIIAGVEAIIEIAEYTINNREEDILEDLISRHPDVLCFSCYIWNVDHVVSIAREFNKLSPETKIWAGGPEVSYETEKFLLENPFFTGVMTGEGEDTFKELCGFYVSGLKKENLEDKNPENAESNNSDSNNEDRKKRDIKNKDSGNKSLKNEDRENEDLGNEDWETEALKKIKGIVFFDKAGDLVSTGMRPCKDLNEIPFFYNDTELFSNRIIYYESSRGCPFSCSYCLSSLDKKLRFRDIEKVKKELLFFLQKKVPQVKFIDRTFNCNHTHSLEIWRFIKENDNDITNFHFEVAADLFTKKELDLICSLRPGLIQLEIGVQSTNPKTLNEIKRVTDLDKLRSNVLHIKESGNIHQHLDLIAGLPYEDYDSFRHSFDEIFSLHPDQLQLGFLKVLKGSYIHENAARYGLLYNHKPPYEVHCNRWISYEDMRRIKRVEAMLEIYYNSGQYEITLRLLSCILRNMFDFFLALGDYYLENGLYYMEHSRLKRCSVLLDFLKEALKDKILFSESGLLNSRLLDSGLLKSGISESGLSESDTGDISIFEESLVFDLYYRENCKTRPQWAVDRSLLKEMTRKYCKDGKLTHIEPFHYEFPLKDIPGFKELPKKLADPIWVLFDYTRRDPLTHQALCTMIKP